MAKYRMTVFSNPVAGKEAEYNRWYDEQHLPDVCAVPGFVSAERYELSGDGSHRYAAIYNIETDDIDGALADLNSRAGTERMMLSDAIDLAGVDMRVWKMR